MDHHTQDTGLICVRSRPQQNAGGNIKSNIHCHDPVLVQTHQVIRGSPVDGAIGIVRLVLECQSGEWEGASLGTPPNAVRLRSVKR
jgi:hypothetical protein